MACRWTSFEYNGGVATVTLGALGDTGAVVRKFNFQWCATGAAWKDTCEIQSAGQPEPVSSPATRGAPPLRGE